MCGVQATSSGLPDTTLLKLLLLLTSAEAATYFTMTNCLSCYRQGRVFTISPWQCLLEQPLWSSQDSICLATSYRHAALHTSRVLTIIQPMCYTCPLLRLPLRSNLAAVGHASLLLQCEGMWTSHCAAARTVPLRGIAVQTSCTLSHHGHTRLSTIAKRMTHLPAYLQHMLLPRC